ncbi:unnamed protein product [Caenorhabditis angaria]|uniref:Uncharacterized protein n=1 Tax=Caenorhabditis angaria TaxID=860376 RepID=A0A9P1IQS4_9PELO|nr:unnamed protein product [Caenorhabditis angaria]
MSGKILKSQFFAGQKRGLLQGRDTNPFGIVLDIDGVLVRGRNLLPRVREAFKLILDEKGNFKIPTVFLTNGTNSTQKEKAEKLGEQLGFRIPPENMLMAQSPLRMFQSLHDKQVLAVGQKNAKKIANSVGFRKVTKIEQLTKWFSHLDCTDFSRKIDDSKENARARANFKPIEAILLLGEPLKWESSLQLIFDCLYTHGKMDSLCTISKTQVPIIACNVDLVWMADVESRIPRIGHGVFIHSLETIYEKMTGKHLQYTAVLGKPTEISYLQAAHKIQRIAKGMGMKDVKNMYVIGKGEPGGATWGPNQPQPQIHSTSCIRRFFLIFEHVPSDPFLDIGYFGLVENSTSKMATASETMQHIGSVSSGLEDSTGHEEDIGMIFDEKAADWIMIAQEAREDAKKWKLSERQADVVLNPLMKKVEQRVEDLRGMVKEKWAQMPNRDEWRCLRYLRRGNKTNVKKLAQLMEKGTELVIWERENG